MSIPQPSTEVDRARAEGVRLLAEVLRYGDGVVERCISGAAAEFRRVVAGAWLHRVLHHADGVRVLVAGRSSCASAPCRRALLEAYLQLRLLLTDFTEANATLMHTSSLLDQLRRRKAWAEAASRQGRIHSSLERDKVVGNLFQGRGDMIQAEIDELEQLLDEPHAREARAQLETKNGVRPWHEVSHKLPKLPDVAEHLGFSALYWLEYQALSRRVHGHDVATLIRAKSKTELFVPSIRDDSDALSAPLSTISWSTDAVRELTAVVLPGELEQFANWYKTSEFSPFIHDVQQLMEP